MRAKFHGHGLQVSSFNFRNGSADELVLSLFVSGPDTTTLPIKMWSGIREEITPTIAAVSSLLIALTVVMYAGVEVVRQTGERRNKYNELVNDEGA
ncbi:MAG: hypothetical protein E5W17_00750 [Mesorhizobium sp.]|uniref:ABC transporter permease n=1 Tax=Mesorhizobium sp. M2A.F.Ca.ET.029.05.1.1 TaxID=2496658 RepID=UPI000FD36C41|nr:hypothetical protein [Mesorhizobium sp. M2A.F.Ca.ET.029.05.1.1]RVC99807.1 hypothetical protein EN753_25455 [Mesorhizobium sp. M2A.F.Ca.ET.029.05.1.1]TIU44138.1 MAG: hypothetical protein E5W17_00750 [Mesorhizobium sp.]TIX08799.1 MAG: hypothetical protein E5V41_32680 [Mesorhizobium sp.]